MGWNSDGTLSRGGSGFNANFSSVKGGVFGTDDPPSARPRRQQFSMEALDQAEQRDAEHARAMQQQQMMQQQQRQQQMQLQQQRQQQMQMQQQRQMAMQQQQQQQQQMQMQQQRQQQMAMQQQRQQQMAYEQQQQQRGPPAPDNEHDNIKAKNQASSFAFADCWNDTGAPSYRGGKARKGITSKECGGFNGANASPPDKSMAAGGFARDRSHDRYGSDNAPPPSRQGHNAGGSSISLGSSCWDGSAASPRRQGGSTLMGRGASAGGQRREASPAPMMRAGPGMGMNMYDAPAAGGGARPDQRAHLGSNICFG